MLPRIALSEQPRQIITERVPFPEHQCFCCHNRGYIYFGWLEELSETLDNKHRNIQPDLPRVCVRPNCAGVWNPSAQKYEHLSQTVSSRSLRDIGPEACEALHHEGKKRWQEDCKDWVLNQRNQQKPAQEISKFISQYQEAS